MFHIALTILVVDIVICKELLVYSNFNDGSLVYGYDPSIMQDFITLQNDIGQSGFVKKNCTKICLELPDKFTICSSMLIKYMTTKNNFIEMLQNDGTHWFQLDFEHLRDLENMSERISMNLDNIEKFWESKIPINPHSW